MHNIIGYSLYLGITFYITLFVGYKVYQLGMIYLTYLIHHHAICISINRILLIGYYLVNLGFSAVTLQQWNRIDNYTDLLQQLASKTGNILLILGILHVLNLSIIYFFSQNKTINYNNYGNKF